MNKVEKNLKIRNGKKVRFDRSQQWRLNRKQIKVNSSDVRKNLDQIKRGVTPLKRAQAAYYGNETKTVRIASPQVKIAHHMKTEKKLPVHARLGNRTNLNQKNVLKSVNSPQPNVAQLLAQKRALRLKTMQEKRRIQQIMANQAQLQNISGGMRSDHILRTQVIKRKKNNRPNNLPNYSVRQNSQANSAADLSVSVANDLALQRHLVTDNVPNYINRPMKRRLNRNTVPMHSKEVNPQIQREIAIIQERSRRLNLDSASGLNIRAAATTPLQVMTLNEPLPNITRPLGGVTTVTRAAISQPLTGQKLSLHERFSLL